MKKALIAFGMLLMTATTAKADLTSRLSTSIQLTVDSPSVTTERIGSSYSVSGNNITAASPGGLGSFVSGSGASFTPTTYSLTTDGDAFSFVESYIEGDSTTSTQAALSSGQFSAPVLQGQSTTFTGGTAGSLAGTINSAGSVSLTAGGAGTTATGQFVSEITID
jgi:hypothetical protein